MRRQRYLLDRGASGCRQNDILIESQDTRIGRFTLIYICEGTVGKVVNGGILTARIRDH